MVNNERRIDPNSIARELYWRMMAIANTSIHSWPCLCGPRAPVVDLDAYLEKELELFSAYTIVLQDILEPIKPLFPLASDFRSARELFRELIHLFFPLKVFGTLSRMELEHQIGKIERVHGDLRALLLGIVKEVDLGFYDDVESALRFDRLRAGVCNGARVVRLIDYFTSSAS